MLLDSFDWVDSACITVRTPSLRARRPAARGMTGRSGLRLAAGPHRPVSIRFAVGAELSAARPQLRESARTCRGCPCRGILVASRVVHGEGVQADRRDRVAGGRVDVDAHRTPDTLPALAIRGVPGPVPARATDRSVL